MNDESQRIPDDSAVNRRDFVKRMTALGLSAAAAGAFLSLTGCSSGETLPSTDSTETPPSPSQTESENKPQSLPSSSRLAVARGKSPSVLVRAAVDALGGIGQFVKAGDDVIVKPNICVAYHTYEYAATTNPEVVATLVSLCLQAGAKRVRVMDQPFGGTAEKAYAISGIEEAVKDAGGEMEIMSVIKYRDVPIPDGKDIASWPVYRDVLEADVLIDVPIAKHHGLARLTLGMKNLMGLVQKPTMFHFNLGQRIADLTSLLMPDLTVIDAVRILTNHGPTGGSLDDVKRTNTVIASRDIVAADSYAATLFGLSGDDLPAVRAAAAMGPGVKDLNNMVIEEIEA